MGLFSSIGSALGSVGGIIGSALNGITGATSAAQQQQRYTQDNMYLSQGMSLEQMQAANQYALEQMKQNYNYQVNSAKNAIQWQMQDLKNAGLNPILAAGYSGANLGGSVGASGVSGSGPSGGTPGGQFGDINGLTNIASAVQGIREAQSRIDLNDARTANETAHNPYIPEKDKSEIARNNSTATNNTKQAGLFDAKTTSEKGNPTYLIGKAINAAEKKLGRKLTKQEEKQIYDDPDKFFEDMMNGRLK